MTVPMIVIAAYAGFGLLALMVYVRCGEMAFFDDADFIIKWLLWLPLLPVFVVLIWRRVKRLRLRRDSHVKSMQKDPQP